MTQQAIETNKGDCLNMTVTWRDSEGVPTDLTDKTVEILDAQPPTLADADIVIEDAAAGRIKIVADTAIADTLNLGMRNWFRLALKSPDGCSDVTPRIWIDVQ